MAALLPSITVMGKDGKTYASAAKAFSMDCENLKGGVCVLTVLQCFLNQGTGKAPKLSQIDKYV